jgi:hypothetical protein
MANLYRRIHFSTEQHAYVVQLLEQQLIDLPITDPTFDFIYHTFSKLRDCNLVVANGTKPKPKP